MSLFFVVYTLVFIGAFLSMKLRHSKVLDVYVVAVYVMITANVCLRYWQGTDYFSYR